MIRELTYIGMGVFLTLLGELIKDQVVIRKARFKVDLLRADVESPTTIKLWVVNKGSTAGCIYVWKVATSVSVPYWMWKLYHKTPAEPFRRAIRRQQRLRFKAVELDNAPKEIHVDVNREVPGTITVDHGLGFSRTGWLDVWISRAGEKAERLRCRFAQTEKYMERQVIERQRLKKF